MVFTSVAYTQEKEDEASKQASELYQNMSKLSMSERKSMIRGLSPEKKSAVWRVHLKRYLARPDFTDEQKQIISEVIELATPQFFEITSDSPEFEKKVNQPLQNIMQRALQLFPPKVASEIFTQIGGAAPAKSAMAHTTKNAPEAECNCSIKSDWCPSPWTCKGGGCVWQNTGCGSLGMYACTGLCMDEPTW